MISLSEGALKVADVCAAVSSGERVLVVTDPGRPPEVARALAAAARDLGAVVWVGHMSEDGPPGGDPPEAVVRAMTSAEVVLFATSRTMFHSQRVKEAVARGARIGTLTGCGSSTLTQGAIEADFAAIAPICDAVSSTLGAAREARIVAPSGTDLRLSLAGRRGVGNTGLCRTPGSLVGIPDIEAYIAPVEGSAEGRIVVDGSTSVFGVVDTAIEIIVEAGHVKAIRGGDHASRLEAKLLAFDDPTVLNVAELGLGLNPMARVVGNLIEDEAAYGTGHFALGDNSTFGGMLRSPIHVDLVYMHPTVTLDDVELTHDGRLVSPPGFSEGDVARLLRPQNVEDSTK